MSSCIQCCGWNNLSHTGGIPLIDGDYPYSYRAINFVMNSRLFGSDYELTLAEQVYPKKELRYTSKIAGRDSYFNFFWRDSRTERNNLGAYSIGLAHTNSRGKVKLSGDVRESIWPMDAGTNFTTRTTVTGSSTAADYASQPLSGEGELQNNYSQAYGRC